MICCQFSRTFCCVYDFSSQWYSCFTSVRSSARSLFCICVGTRIELYTLCQPFSRMQLSIERRHVSRGVFVCIWYIRWQHRRDTSHRYIDARRRAHALTRSFAHVAWMACVLRNNILLLLTLGQLLSVGMAECFVAATSARVRVCVCACRSVLDRLSVIVISKDTMTVCCRFSYFVGTSFWKTKKLIQICLFTISSARMQSEPISSLSALRCWISSTRRCTQIHHFRIEKTPFAQLVYEFQYFIGFDMFSGAIHIC